MAGDWPSVTSASLPDLVDTAFAFLVCFDLFDTINLISFAFLVCCDSFDSSCKVFFIPCFTCLILCQIWSTVFISLLLYYSYCFSSVLGWHYFIYRHNIYNNSPCSIVFGLSNITVYGQLYNVNIPIYRVFFYTGPHLKVLSTQKLIWARLGVSRTIYVNVDSPYLGFPYFKVFGEAQCKKTPCICMFIIYCPLSESLSF